MYIMAVQDNMLYQQVNDSFQGWVYEIKNSF